jgi:hypothetical protein
VSQGVLDWSFQMAMQAGMRSTLGCIDAFGKEDFVPDLAAVTVPTLILHWHGRQAGAGGAHRAPGRRRHRPGDADRI